MSAALRRCDDCGSPLPAEIETGILCVTCADEEAKWNDEWDETEQRWLEDEDEK